MPRRKAEESIGERLERLRRAAGLTQQELAEEVGIAQPNLSDYERGVCLPAAPTIARLARVLGVSADTILGLKPFKPRKSPEATDTRLSKKLKQIRSLPEHDQRAIMRMINALLATRDRAEGRAVSG